MLKVTTETGSVYMIDLENKFWSKNNAPKDRLLELQVGTTLAWPWNCPTGWERASRPEIGKHLFISSRNVFYVSTLVESIEELADESY